jgi:diguanylate cyclase (GGDEF)-like protein
MSPAADAATLTPLLWMVALQLGLYALGWVVCASLLGEDREAVAHWGLFLLLLGVGLLLAGLRGEPRVWWAYNGANLITLVAFALMRRGSERFVRAPSSDREQLVMLLLVGGALALVDQGPAGSSWRIVLAYGGQGWCMLRMMTAVRMPLRAEFGRAAYRAIVVPGLVIAALLLLLALRQALSFGAPQEMHRGATSIGLMTTYLVGSALFNFGFMVLVTQRLVVRLRRASRRDALTGLFNRGAIDGALAHQWALGARSGETFAVLLIDVDHFKRINDNHGHAVGDRVLVHVASVIEGQARQADSVGRYGGEEFMIVAPGSDLEGACQAAERLRRALEGEAIHARASDLRVTVSIGVAARRADDGSIEALVGRADRALYRAKAAGRNRVEHET